MSNLSGIISNILIITINALVFAYTFQLKKCACVTDDDGIHVNKNWKYKYILYYSIITACVFTLILALRLGGVNLVSKNKVITVLLGSLALVYVVTSIIQAYSLFFFMKKIHLQKEIDSAIKKRGCDNCVVNDCLCRDKIEMYIIYYYSIILFVIYTITFLLIITYFLISIFR